MIRKTIDKLLETLVIMLMSTLVLDVLWQVFSRYILSSPSSYTDELAGFLLIWVGLLGSAYVCGQKEHLAIDILIHKVGPKSKLSLELFIYGITALFAVFVLVTGGVWLVYTRIILNETSASLQINMGYVYLVLPLSGLLILYYSVDNAMKTIRDSKTENIPN